MHNIIQTQTHRFVECRNQFVFVFTDLSAANGNFLKTRMCIPELCLSLVLESVLLFNDCSILPANNEHN